MNKVALLILMLCCSCDTGSGEAVPKGMAETDPTTYRHQPIGQLLWWKGIRHSAYSAESRYEDYAVSSFRAEGGIAWATLATDGRTVAVSGVWRYYSLEPQPAQPETPR